MCLIRVDWTPEASTWLHLIIIRYSLSSIIRFAAMLQILLAHSCLYYYLLSLQYTAHFIFIAHLFYILVFFILIFTSLLFHTYIYVYSLVFVFHIIALSMERTDIHFTTGYILYNCVCDEYQSWISWCVWECHGILLPLLWTKTQKSDIDRRRFKLFQTTTKNFVGKERMHKCETDSGQCLQLSPAYSLHELRPCFQADSTQHGGDG